MWRPDRSLRGPDRADAAGHRAAQSRLRRRLHRPLQPRRARGRAGAAAQHRWSGATPSRTPATGAMIWRDGDGQLVAFNMVHRSGHEGWMGPLAVRPDRQGEGLGSHHGAARHRLAQGAGRPTIGLETMPRTVENIGFYSRIGLVPGPLTVTLVRDVPRRAGPRARAALRGGLAARPAARGVPPAD